MEDYRREVLDAAEGILGELSSLQDRLLVDIAEAVCTQMNQRLKAGITNLDCRSAYIPACAMYTAAYLRDLDRNSLSSFTAGTLSLSFDGNSSNLIRMADELMAPWLAVKPVLRGVGV